MRLKTMNYSINGQKYTKIQLQLLCKEKINETVEWQKSIYHFIHHWLSDSPTLQVRTSGTTGTPKTIVVSKHQMIQSALMTSDYFHLKAGQNALLCLSADYIAGKMMIVRALVLGLNLIIVEPRSMPLSKLNNEMIHFAAMVPLQLHQILLESSLNQIQTLIVGGGAVSQQLRAAVKNIQTKVYATYGMTETLSHIAIMPLNGSQTSYQTLKGIEITQDERECLVIRAPHCEKELVTNDRVIIHSKNKFQLLGRVDNIINTGGIKIHPEEVEQKLDYSNLARRFFISSRPDKKLENKIILLIEGSELTASEKDKLNHHIKNNLSKFERPKEIYFIKKFIETPTGKIQRKATGLMIANYFV